MQRQRPTAGGRSPRSRDMRNQHRSYGICNAIGGHILGQIGFEADFLARNQSIAFDANDRQIPPFRDTK